VSVKGNPNAATRFGFANFKSIADANATKKKYGRNEN